MTEARASRLALEVLTQATDPQARLSRLALEALTQATDPAARLSRLAVEVLWSVVKKELAAAPTGGSSVVATLSKSSTLAAVSGTTAGQSSASAALTQLNQLTGSAINGGATVVGKLESLFAGTSAGSTTVTATLELGGGALQASLTGRATVTGTLWVDFPHPYPTPYPFGWGGPAVSELAAVIRGGSNMGNLSPIWVSSLRGTITGGVAPYTEVSRAGVTASTNAWAGIATTIDGDPATFWGGGSGAWQTVGYYMQYTFPTAVKLGRIEWDQTRPADGGADGYYSQGWTLEAKVGGFWKPLVSGTAAAPGTAGSNIPVEAQVWSTDYRVLITVATDWWKWVVYETRFYTSTYYARLTVLSPKDASGVSAGVGSMTGTLSAWMVSGGEVYNYLAGVIAGVATVENTWFLTIGRPGSDGTGYVQPQSKTFLSLYSNVTAGFDPTDDASGHDDFVSQSYPDGNVTEFARYLSLYSNVTAGFDPTDDASSRPDFVGQSYPDGNVTEFARYLSLWVNVIPGFPQENGRLIILPGWSPKGLPIRPPSGKLT